MTTSETHYDLLKWYCIDVAQRAKKASITLALAESSVKDQWLRRAAELLVQGQATILAKNQLDLQAAPEYGLSESAIDRLKLNEKRIADIAKALEQIAAMPDPVHEVIEQKKLPSGLDLQKVRVPLGVVFFIYESRPNVTADAAAICIKSGNAVILRGGKEARHSSSAIVEVLHRALKECGLPLDAVQLVEPTEREAISHFLKLNQWIDVAIPRGGSGLIRRVIHDATMPVIKHYDGNCHLYVDEGADIAMASRLLVNSKCHRMGVCNACESLVIHSSVLNEFIPWIVDGLSPYNIELRGDERFRAKVPSAKVATEEDWKTEYLGPILSVKVVDSLQQAIDHINLYSSHHTDAIVTNNPKSADAFVRAVDSAAVMVNASTRFNDGGELGMGAEIGISTDKFHARGPCGVRELTSYKYIVRGSGQIRT